MKIINYPSPIFTIIILFCTIFIFHFSAIAQKNKDVIAQLDTSAFKGRPLLNNGLN